MTGLDRLVLHPYLAVARCDDGDHIQQGALAAAARSHDADELAIPDGQRDVADRGVRSGAGAIGLANGGENQSWRGSQALARALRTKLMSTASPYFAFSQVGGRIHPAAPHHFKQAGVGFRRIVVVVIPDRFVLVDPTDQRRFRRSRQIVDLDDVGDFLGRRRLENPTPSQGPRPAWRPAPVSRTVS